MRHVFLVLVLGLVSGIGAHLAWFRANQPGGADPLARELSWMKSELKLTDAQVERIRSIHQASSPRLTALAAQVASMREEYAAFERERVATDQVDFIEFAHFVERRRAIDSECLASTRRLVTATSELMTPLQRATYFRLLEPSLKAHDLSPPG
jgi:Spy/CpxP family protein refolding chaperone